MFKFFVVIMLLVIMLNSSDVVTNTAKLVEIQQEASNIKHNLKTEHRYYDE